ILSRFLSFAIFDRLARQHLLVHAAHFRCTNAFRLLETLLFAWSEAEFDVPLSFGALERVRNDYAPVTLKIHELGRLSVARGATFRDFRDTMSSSFAPSRIKIRLSAFAKGRTGSGCTREDNQQYK
ncbi:hypothetical protein PMAYCL1PPCAC_21727, partial [Pristionchus mayeri]